MEIVTRINKEARRSSLDSKGRDRKNRITIVEKRDMMKPSPAQRVKE